jgi:hypothetical protein
VTGRPGPLGARAEMTVAVRGRLQNEAELNSRHPALLGGAQWASLNALWAERPVWLVLLSC